MTVHSAAHKPTKASADQKPKTHGAASPTPAREQPDVNAQQRLGDSTFRNLTPDAVLALQRTHGNQFVQRMAEKTHQPKEIDSSAPPFSFLTRHDDAVQRTVQGMNITPAKLLTYFKKNYAPNYQAALTAGMDDTQLTTEFATFVNSPDLYYMSQACDVVCRIIEHRAAGSPANQQTQIGGVQVTITHLSGNVPNGLAITIGGNKYDYHSGEAAFEANVLVEGQATEVDKWEIGFIQTVFQGDRRLLYTNAKGEMHELRIYMDTPIRDSQRGYGGPWINNVQGTYGVLTAKSRDQATLRMTDKPGFAWTADPGDVVNEVSGRDAFKAWLVMRKKDGSEIQYLRRWDWHVDYTGDAGQAGALGGRLDQGPVVDAVGAGAVIGGPGSLDSLKFDDRKLTMAETQMYNGALLPDVNAFKEMKKQAKKPRTPFSGMLPTKKYNELVTQFIAHMTQGKKTDAFMVITTLSNELDKMDKATKYWASDKLKQQYFTPIYQAVQKQLTDLLLSRG